MPNKCSAVNCRSGYEKQSDEEKITFHNFPLKNPSLLKEWSTKVARLDFTPTVYSKLCSKHFVDEDFVVQSQDTNASRPKNILQKRRLKPHAVPSRFPNCASYFSCPPVHHRTGNALSSSRLESSVTLNDSRVEEFLSSDVIANLDGVKQHMKDRDAMTINQSDTVIILKIDLAPPVPKILYSLKIFSNFEFCASMDDQKIKKSKFKFLNGSKTIKYYSMLDTMINFLEENCNSSDNVEKASQILNEYCFNNDGHVTNKIRFLTEQLELANRSQKRYSNVTLSLALLLYTYNSNFYRRLQQMEILTLPSVRKLQQLNGSINKQSIVSYLKLRESKLNQFEKYVILILDEIYIKKKVEYFNGCLYGYSNSGELASTVLCFMISSLCGQYRDIVKMVPLARINSDIIYQNCLNILNELNQLDFQVVALCADNHASNRSLFLNKFCNGELKSKVQNPADISKPLFLIFDPTHNFKNIYNNFQKSKVFEFHSSSSFKMASFHHIESLFELESEKPLKIAHKLKPIVLQPNNLQRTSVKLASSVFHESTLNGLKHFSSDSSRFEWMDTYNFLSFIKKMWDIINVKTPFKGKHKRESAMDPIRSIFDWQFEYLDEVINFFEQWERCGGRGLSRETFLANKQTITAIKELAFYLLSSEGFNYVLLGKVQSDNLEERFGWYRMKCGGNYLVSLKDVVVTEQKIKTLSLIKFSSFTVDDIDNFDAEDNNLDHEVVSEIAHLISLSHWPSEDDGYILLYVGGYIARSTAQNCEKCKEILIEETILPCISNLSAAFFNFVDRGGLKKPSDFTFSICSYCWAIYTELDETTQLKNKIDAKNSRDWFYEIVCTFLDDSSIISVTHCENGHCFLKKIIFKFYNCLMKNFVTKCQNSMPSKPKYLKFSHST